MCHSSCVIRGILYTLPAIYTLPEEFSAVKKTRAAIEHRADNGHGQTEPDGVSPRSRRRLPA